MVGLYLRGSTPTRCLTTARRTAPTPCADPQPEPTVDLQATWRGRHGGGRHPCGALRETWSTRDVDFLWKPVKSLRARNGSPGCTRRRTEKQWATCDASGLGQGGVHRCLSSPYPIAHHAWASHLARDPTLGPLRHGLVEERERPDDGRSVGGAVAHVDHDPATR